MSLKIMDCTGKCVFEMDNKEFEKSENNTTINVSKLPKGLYFVSLTGSNLNCNAKFVKQ